MCQARRQHMRTHAVPKRLSAKWPVTSRHLVNRTLGMADKEPFPRGHRFKARLLSDHISLLSDGTAFWADALIHYGLKLPSCLLPGQGRWHICWGVPPLLSSPSSFSLQCKSPSPLIRSLGKGKEIPTYQYLEWECECSGMGGCR